MAASDLLPYHQELYYMRIQFDNVLDEITQICKNYLMIMDPEEYYAVMQKVKKLKKKKEPTEEQIRYLQRYNIKDVGLRERLFMPKGPRGFPKYDRYFVHTDEIFEVLQNIHDSTKHGSKQIMHRIIDTKYVNITHNMINEYVMMCRRCQRKKELLRIKRTIKLKNRLKALFKKEMLRRGEVDLLDLREFNDNEFNFILTYRDHVTNFTLLRAVRTASVKEVAHVLLDFFAIVGAPSVLQSPQGRDFMHEVVKEMIRVWPHLVIVQSEMIMTEANTRASETRTELIYDFVRTWLNTNDNTTLYQAVRYAQMTVNLAPADSGETTSYELMFNKRMQFGISAELRPYVRRGLYIQELMELSIREWGPPPF